MPESSEKAAQSGLRCPRIPQFRLCGKGGERHQGEKQTPEERSRRKLHTTAAANGISADASVAAVFIFLLEEKEVMAANSGCSAEFHRRLGSYLRFAANVKDATTNATTSLQLVVLAQSPLPPSGPISSWIHEMSPMANTLPAYRNMCWRVTLVFSRTRAATKRAWKSSLRESPSPEDREDLGVF